MTDELTDPADPAGPSAYSFLLSIAVMRHLQADPVLPVQLLDDDRPAEDLRRAFRRFDEVVVRRLTSPG
jgi:phenylacetic acid degradation operon negative regulatory protein